MNPWISYGNENYYKGGGIFTNLRYQPTDALRLSVSPSIDWNDNGLQYVDSYETTTDNYILARIRQVTYSASVRANYIITPNLSVEYWGQPFISSGEYSDFKQVLSPNSDYFEERHISLAEDQIYYSDESESYFIDENRDGTNEAEVNDPNFNFMQFRSNFVVRWEYIPGSTLFVVWTSSASDWHNSRENRFSHLATDLRQTDGTNIFLIKYTYRFVL